MDETKPNFLIVGAMKAGTSTLRYHLNQHPDVFICKKELHYFSTDKIYERGIEWYLSNFSKDNKYKVIGEKSASYSYSKFAAKRIYQFKNDMKLIWILRDPIKRAFSNYLHAYNKNVSKQTFTESINNYDDPKLKYDYQNYIRRSI